MRVGEVVAVGGLGGGGDSGGALSLAIALRRAGVHVIVVGMVPYRLSDIRGAEKVTGALVKVSKSTRAPDRFFEPHISALGWETYALCLYEPIDSLLEGGEALIERGVGAWVGADFGGDAIVRGDEPSVGSVVEDAVGLAVLVETTRRGNAKSLVAVGSLGAEWGGCIPMELLAENVVALNRRRAYLGAYEPRGEAKHEFLSTAEFLLSRVPSFMLTVYRDALRKRYGKHRYRVAYFKGFFTVKELHRYIYMFKARPVFELNAFCRAALKGGVNTVFEAVQNRSVNARQGIKDWERVLLKLAKISWDFRSIL